jgi:hypothetical protein
MSVRRTLMQRRAIRKSDCVGRDKWLLQLYKMNKSKSMGIKLSGLRSTIQPLLLYSPKLQFQVIS